MGKWVEGRKVGGRKERQREEQLIVLVYAGPLLRHTTFTDAPMETQVITAM